MLNYITSGESHNQYMLSVLEGMPSGVPIDMKSVNHEMWRRQQGYGRGGRMQIETDTVKLTSGILKNTTTGSPIGILLENSDVKIDKMPEIDRPRPGHADLMGSLKYQGGIRGVLERASARETTLRVAVGGIVRQFLNQFGVKITSHVFELGKVSVDRAGITFDDIVSGTKDSELNCICSEAEAEMKQLIDKAKEDGDTYGGRLEVRVEGVPPGLGSFASYNTKLDAKIAAAIISVQAVKEVGFGLAEELGRIPGSQSHDEIAYDKKEGYTRKTNNLGGFEGGMTTGEEIVVVATKKPISTLRKPLDSVNMKTKKTEKAAFERSDVCAVAACSVICEAVVAYEIANAMIDKFGGDNLGEIKRNYDAYMKEIKK